MDSFLQPSSRFVAAANSLRFSANRRFPSRSQPISKLARLAVDLGNDSRFSLHGALDSGDDLGNFQDVRAKRAIAVGENRALRAIGLRKIRNTHLVIPHDHYCAPYLTEKSYIRCYSLRGTIMPGQELLDEFFSLPAEAQRQVLDFIAFLRQRYTVIEPASGSLDIDLISDSFIGMWRKRQDLSDSTAWVRSVRETEW